MKRLLGSFAFVSALALATPFVAQGSPITINNPSFELPVTGFFTPGPPTSWTGSGDVGVFNANLSPGVYYSGAGSTDGVQVAYLNAGTISQTLSAVLTANTAYTFRADVGDRKDTLFLGFNFELWAGGILLATGTGATPNDGFQPWTVSFLAPPGHPALGNNLEILFRNLPSLGQAQVNVDNLRGEAVTAVPEPATLIMLGTGLAFGARGLKRRQGRLAKA